MTHGYPFVKGHGTRNDFVLLPDPDGSVHGLLSPSRVAALCDRRAGIGGDGVIRVVRTADLASLGDPEDDAVAALGAGAEWFMDYRNSDGSDSQMCGNGIRVLARHLVSEGLVDASVPLSLGTRDGVKTLVFGEDGQITVDMGMARVLGEAKVGVGSASWPAQHVDMGNPHAVAFVDGLDDAGSLLEPPTYDAGAYPDGTNVEFVVRHGERHIAMRVHERGSGETMSCGTGACAAMVAAVLADDVRRDSVDVTYRVDVPGGTLSVTWTAADRILLTGPAVLVASGATAL